MATHPPSVRNPLPDVDLRDARVRRGAKALVASAERLLLVQEQHADGATFWTLPGGGIEPGESAGEALRRELAEELRCDALVRSAVDAFCYAHTSREDTLSLHTVFDCALLSTPEPAREEGILDHRWVEPAALPATTLPCVRNLVDKLARR